MASGSYAQTIARQPRRPEALTQGRGKLWLCVASVMVVATFLFIGVLSHSTPSYLATGGGQVYAIQVGGDQAGTWQHDPAARTTPTPVQSSSPPTTYTVVAEPSLSAAFIDQVLSTYKSPAVGRGQALYDLGIQYNIDPAFALAFFMHESSFGTQGEARKSLSLGNLRCIPNYRCEDNFAQFDSWEDGFKAWYQLIGNLYVAQWGLTTVDQIIPRYAPQADHNDEQGYINSLKHALDTWHAGQIIVR